jgi:hypothetical protein
MVATPAKIIEFMLPVFSMLATKVERVGQETWSGRNPYLYRLGGRSYNQDQTPGV